MAELLKIDMKLIDKM